ncbi:hypothetical protein L3Q67_38530 [Saccharothrix sp. AJ9571]|nr:hypothetical protein L3Q67_38530 [Saccharothrix sp. AJ9571]
MAQRWYEDDSSGPVEQLDPIFRDGYAPALHGMLKALSVVTDGPPVWDPVFVKAEDMIFDPTEMPSTENNPWLNPIDPRAGAVHVTLHPILRGSAHEDGSRDLSVDEFFSHAEILTGQDIGRVAGKPGQNAEALRFEGQGEGEGGTGGGWIKDAVTVIRRAGFSDAESLQYNKLDQLQAGSAWWGDHWTGPPGSVPADAHARCSIIDNWQLERRRPALGVLSDYLVRYGAILHGARFNLNSLMGACVKQLEQVDATSSVNKGLVTGWKFFSGIAGVATAGPMAGVAAVDMMFNVLENQNGNKALEPGGFYGTLYSFLQKADELMESTSQRVGELIREMHANFPISDGPLGPPNWTEPAPQI